MFPTTGPKSQNSVTGMLAVPDVPILAKHADVLDHIEVSWIPQNFSNSFFFSYETNGAEWFSLFVINAI
jgi:hypothetical protein